MKGKIIKIIMAVVVFAAVMTVIPTGMQQINAASEACAADGYEQVYTYRNGRVHEMLCASHGYFGLDPASHVICFAGAQSGDYWTMWYKIADGKAKLVAAEKGMDSMDGPSFEYKLNGKKVSKSKYQRYVKKITGKKVQIEYRKNTKVNRSKYLK